MITDALEQFVPPQAPLSLVAAAGVAIPSPGIIDLLGGGPGTPVTNIVGTAALPGQADARGVGPYRPEIRTVIGTAAANGTGTPSLITALQAAPDDGANNPGTWQTLAQTAEMLVAQLTAGQIITRFPYLPPFPFNLRPRFLRLLFIVSAAEAFGAGTIAWSCVVPPGAADDPFQLQAAKNYTVRGIV